MSNKIVPSTYRAIIDDVMQGIRHEFDEYGIDESVLADLQQRWESKVIASNVADFESGGPSIPPLAPPPMYPPAPQMPHYPGYQAPQMPTHHYPPPMPPQPPAPVGHPIKAEPVDRFPLSLPPQYMAHQQAANGQGHFILPRNAPAGVPQAAGGTAAARFATPAAVPEIPPLPSLPQLDGAASDDEDDGDSPPPNHALPRSSHPSLPPPIPPLPSLGGIPPLPSLNVGIPPLPSFHQAPTPGPTPGPSSAPAIPPLPSLGGAAAGEEINSDLDDSDSDVGDDPDESTGPETDIVFCTYDKVQRVKSKWKCVLKDGMVHVNGKDYLFARCNCEFEW